MTEYYLDPTMPKFNVGTEMGRIPGIKRKRRKDID